MISFKRKRTKLINFFLQILQSNELIDYLNNPDEIPQRKAEPYGEYPGSDAVVILHEDTFEEAINTFSNLLVMFYAPGNLWKFGLLDFCFQQRDLSSNLFGFVVLGCGHCTLFKPVFAEAAKIIKKTQIGTLAAIDGSVYHEISKRYDLTGYPTMKHFKNGRLTGDYDGRRNVDSIFKFMANHDKKKKDEL